MNQIKKQNADETREQHAEMTTEDVVGFFELLDHSDIDFWVDGGWGVDALLGKQTRQHSDLDLLIRVEDLPKVHRLLEENDYKIMPRDDNTDIHFHVEDNKGHVLDFTAFEFDEEGNGIYGPRENDEMNPAESFQGLGAISGHVVKCVSPDYQVQFHRGYELDDNDYQDVKALVEKFELELPPEYKKFEQ